MFFGLGTLITVIILGTTTLGGLTLLSLDPMVTEQQRNILLSGVSTVGGMTALLGFIALAIFLFVGFYLSYKFVGPLYRLENWLEQNIANPSDETLKLRPGDEMERIVNLLHDQILKYKNKKS